LTWCYC